MVVDDVMFSQGELQEMLCSYLISLLVGEMCADVVTVAHLPGTDLVINGCSETNVVPEAVAVLKTILLNHNTHHPTSNNLILT